LIIKAKGTGSLRKRGILRLARAEKNKKHACTMSADLQWYVAQGEQQFGPYTGEQLVEFSTAGNITPEAMVWTEGMAEWLPASQIPGLFPNAAPPSPAPASITHAAPAFGSKPTAALGMRTPLGVDDPYPSTGIKAANFVLWLGLFLGGLTLMLIGMLLLGTAASAVANQAIANQAAASQAAATEAAATEATTTEATTTEATATEATATGATATGVVTSEAANGSEMSNSDLGKMGFGGLILFAGALLNIASVIPMYIYLYRAWSCLKPGGLARTTPGAAIGYLFIPFFNMYWIFQSFLGLAKDWNRTVSTYSDLKTAPRMPEGVFLIFCIGCFIPPLSFFMIFPVMSRICNGINFFAFRPKPGQYSAFGAKPGGKLAIR
jgi:hypothetical protein